MATEADGVSGGVILGGDKRRRAPSPIWVPGSARVAYKCHMCGTEFSTADVERERHIRHVVQCVKGRDGEMAAIVRHHNETLMENPGWADLEFEAWMRKRAKECKDKGIPFSLETRRARDKPSD